MNKQNYIQNKKDKNQPSIKKAIFKQKQELKKLDYLKKYPYTVVRWPEDRFSAYLQINLLKRIRECLV